MKGFEKVKKILSIPFADHSLGIISWAAFGDSEESATIPWEFRHKIPPGFGTSVTLSSLGHLGNARGAVLEGISSLKTLISPQEGMVYP